MALGATVVLVASARRSLALFIGAFASLFVLSGLGNGSTYKMIPAIFRAKAARAVADGADEATSARTALRLSRALIGLAGAIGAFGGVAVNLTLRQSFLARRSGDLAYAGFIAYYSACLLVTWVVYLRPSPRRLAGV
jgi:NNP family nitrate/nitrite transporter-like MFS transporter